MREGWHVWNMHTPMLQSVFPLLRLDDLKAMSLLCPWCAQHLVVWYSAVTTYMLLLTPHRFAWLKSWHISWDAACGGNVTRPVCAD